MIDISKLEASLAKQRAKMTIEGEAESLLFWIHGFQHFLYGELSESFDELDDRSDENKVERWGFRYSIEEHIHNLEIALSNKRWVSNPKINQMANKEG